MKLRAIPVVLILVAMPVCPAIADQRLSDLMLEIKRLQQEVRQLQGRIEVQQNELSVLKRRQQEQYLDLDARLQERSAGSAGDSRQKPGHITESDLGRQTVQTLSAGRVDHATETGAPPESAATASSASPEEKDAYQKAFDLLKQSDYENAARGFEDLLKRYPNGEYADNALYWLGEINYVQRDYGAALTRFQRIAADYPGSAKIPASLLKIGYIHYEKSDWEQARKALQRVIEQFPDTNEAQLAQGRLDRMISEKR